MNAEERALQSVTGLGSDTAPVDATVVAVKRFPIMEVFGPTIQGEGPVVGEQTIFVRFGGCDFRCKKCDSMHAVMPELVKENAEWLTGEQIYAKLTKMRDETFCSSITLSGGNPLIHDLTDLVCTLKLAGFKLNVETQASYFRPWINLCDDIVLSPKAPGMGEKFEPEKYQNFLAGIDPSAKVAVKIVVFNMQDIDFAVYVFDWTQRISVVNNFYLSLGNSMPPHEPGSPEQPPFFRDALVRDYNQLMEDILLDKRLRHVKVLPQVHVLLWGNSKGK